MISLGGHCQTQCMDHGMDMDVIVCSVNCMKIFVKLINLFYETGIPIICYVTAATTNHLTDTQMQ